MAAIFTPILLVIIFLYQRNKNKLLTDILRENKDLSDQHGKVAKTALEYAKTFDIDKFESIIKREIMLEYDQKIKEKDDKLASQQQKIDEVIEKVTVTFISPLIGELVKQLATQNDQEREKVLAKIPKNTSNLMLKILNKIDENIAKERYKALDGLK
jgi:hypothetical protein